MGSVCIHANVVAVLVYRDSNLSFVVYMYSIKSIKKGCMNGRIDGRMGAGVSSKYICSTYLRR